MTTPADTLPPSTPAAPRRLAFVSTMEGEPWGGSEVLWAETALRLRQQGVAVGASVKWWPQMSTTLDRLREAGVEVAPRRLDLRWKRLLGRFYDGGIFRWLDSFKPELVVLNLDYQSNGLAWMKALRARAIPYVIVVHCVVENNWPGDPENLALALGYREARAVHFVSQGNFNFVRNQLAEPLPQGRIVRNPFNVSYDAAPPWPPEDGTLRLACIGRLQPSAKGQDLLLQVLSQPKWKERPIHVTLYGKGPWRKSLEALKAMYSAENVTFGSFNSNVESIWSTHHALLLPSRYEGLPLVVVEAMLCGRPCIVTDVAGNAELLTDNESGFVAAAPKVEFIDEALERAWQRRPELRQIGLAAARAVRRAIPRDPAGIFAGQLLEELRGVRA